jgi:hypothetical protein
MGKFPEENIWQAIACVAYTGDVKLNVRIFLGVPGGQPLAQRLHGFAALNMEESGGAGCFNDEGVVGEPKEKQLCDGNA